MTEPTGRDVLVPAALAQEIAAVLDGAITSASNDAERIEEAPESDGYTEEDVEDAQTFVDDITAARDAFAALRDQQPPAWLPPIVYDDEAKESWEAHIESVRGWNALLTLTDGTLQEVVIRGASRDDDVALLHVGYWDGNKEPDENTETVYLPVTDVAQIRIY